jgi:hypothetical protein
VPGVNLFGQRLRLQVSWEFEGARYVDTANSVVLPHYDVLNASARFSFNEHFDVYGYVDNITNSLGLTEGNPRAGEVQSADAGANTCKNLCAAGTRGDGLHDVKAGIPVRRGWPLASASHVFHRARRHPRSWRGTRRRSSTRHSRFGCAPTRWIRPISAGLCTASRPAGAAWGSILKQEVAVRKIPARVLFAIVTVVALSALRAAELSGTPADAIIDAKAAQPLEWLKSGNYSALEQYYSQRQSDYEAGKASDEQLYASFRRLYENNWDNEGNFDRWMQAYPASYSATLARGAYLYRMAWSVRGDKYLADTSSEQFDAMSNYLSRARPALLASLKMTSKPYLSTLYLLNASLLDSTKLERQRWLELGTAMDPNNTLLRVRYMWGLRPRWSGSYDEMQSFLQQCQDQHLQPALLARLDMLIHADLAEDAMRAADQNKSFDEWGQVLKLAETAHDAPGTEALIGYARAAWDLNRRAEAERALAQLSDRNLDDAWSLTQVGWMYTSAHRDADAWPLLLKAANLNDSWAQFTVGKTTYLGSPDLHLEADQAGGLEWIRRSAEQCFAQANSFLAAHGHSQTPGCGSQPGTPTGPKQSWLSSSALQWGLFGLLMSLVLGWIMSSRKRAA